MTEPPNKTTTIRLNVLGELEILRSGKSIPLPTNKRACHLLALLAFKTTYDLQELVSIFWAGEHLHHEDPGEVKRVLNNLGQVFTAVRDTLGIDKKVLKSNGTTLRWIESPEFSLTSDVAEFQKLAGSETPADWRTALALARGDVAEHIPLERKLTDSFEPARERQREEVERLRQRLRDAPDDQTEQVLENHRDAARHRRSRRWRLVACVLAGCFALGVAAWTVWPDSTHTRSIPPPGSVVDAQTGRSVRHFVPPAHIPRPESLELEILTWACDLSTKSPCTYPKSNRPLIAHRGDILEIWIRLYNETDTTIPLIGVSVGLTLYPRVFSTKQIFFATDAAFDRPGGKQIARGTSMPTYVQMLPQGEGVTYRASYIPGSTVFTSGGAYSQHPLPDGILQDETYEKSHSPKHIWLSNIGAPACECISRHMTYLHFRVQML